MEYLSLVLITIFALILGVTILLRRNVLKTASLFSLAITVVLWTMSLLFYRAGANFISLKILTSIHYLCMAFAAKAQIYFALSYTNRPS